MAPKTILVVNGNIGQKLLFLSDFYKRFIMHFISIMRVEKNQMTIEFFENGLRILTEKQLTSANDSENNS